MEVMVVCSCLVVGLGVILSVVWLVNTSGTVSLVGKSWLKNETVV